MDATTPTQQPVSSSVTSTTANPTLNTPMAIIVAGLLVAGGIYFGLQGGFTIQRPTNGGNTVDNSLNNNANNDTPQNLVTAGQRPTDSPTNAKISVDDDPMEGNKDAKVTIIEFSDYECPFCKKNFTEVLPSVRTDYVNTGKVKYYYRDFPLSFHEPMATNEAMAANCAREQGGDTAYFKYHDEMFKRTTSNGTGLKESDLTTIAKDLKLDSNKLDDCVKSGKYRDEVSKDEQAGQASGVTGTPSFFVGKSTADGTIDGEIVVGAVPYESLKPIIDKYLQ